MPDPFKDSPLYSIGTALSDRLGEHANIDGWFDELVRYWGEPNGVRLYALELSDLGRRVVEQLTDGNEILSRAVLDEVEAVLNERADPEDLCPEFLDGLNAQLFDLQREDPNLFGPILSKVRQIVGANTKTRWSRMSPLAE